jgi:hypothetical protein
VHAVHLDVVDRVVHVRACFQQDEQLAWGDVEVQALGRGGLGRLDDGRRGVVRDVEEHYAQ